MKRRGAFNTMWTALARRAGDDVVGMGALLGAVPRMLGAAVRGRYPLLSRSRVAMSVLAVLYVISPFDLMPEVVMFLFGTVDDAVVATWAVGALMSEAEMFRAWERGQVTPSSTGGKVTPGDVVD